MPGSKGKPLRVVHRGPLFLALLMILSCRPPVDNPTDAGDDTAGDVGRDSDTPVDGGDDDGDASVDDVPDVGLAPLALTAVQPNHGPFTGGTEVVLRGRGFAEGMTITFGGREVEAADTVVVDDNRISLLTPPGDPGVVDVRLAMPNGDEVILEGGYTFDSWYLDPQTGSAGGGTFIRLLGLNADFRPESVITIDGVEAMEVTWVNLNEMTCRTPPGSIGPADVAVIDEAGESVLVDGFSYYDSSDPRNGGLGGGPIDGSIDVTVIEAMSGEPLPESFVMLGIDGDTPYQGYTDLSGRITFSNPDLSGRQSITASHAPIDVLGEDGEVESQILFESTTIVEFDARSVTILLEPIIPPSIGPPPPGRRGGFIEGELLFEHRGEFGPYEWDIVPEPGPNEAKVAYVYTTQSGINTARMEPGVEGVVFNTAEFIGLNGYSFSIYAAPGTMAVYAFAGLATMSGEGSSSSNIVDFVPYAMGVARGIVVGPDESVRGVHVLMSRQMSWNIDVELLDAPVADETGTPNIYILDAYLDLGAEGVISRPETQIRSSTPYGGFVFPGWVELTGNIAGSSYTIVAGAWTTWGGSDEEQNPWSVVYRTGVTSIDTPIVIDEFLAIPRALSPGPGGVVADHHMEWEALGGANPDFSIATLSIPSGVMPIPYWMVVLRGGVTSYDLPNLPEIAGMPDHPTSDLTWSVWSFSIPDFEFDSWSYRYLISRYWSAYAVDSWYIRLAE